MKKEKAYYRLDLAAACALNPYMFTPETIPSVILSAAEGSINYSN